MTLWRHDHNIRGIKVFRHHQFNWYFLVVFWNCNWRCDGEAWYRISQIGEQAIAHEDKLGFVYESQDSIKRVIGPRGLLLNKGWFSLKLTGQQNRLVVGHPSVIRCQDSYDPLDLILDVANTAISTGIERLSKPRLWKSNISGHIPLESIPAIEDRTELERALRSIGIINGTPYPPRSLETIESELKQALGISEFDSPFLA